MTGAPLSTPDNPNLCTTCGAMVREPNTYHPYAFCVLVKAGLDAEEVVHEAVRFYERHGWPEAKPSA